MKANAKLKKYAVEISTGEEVSGSVIGVREREKDCVLMMLEGEDSGILKEYTLMHEALILGQMID